MPARQSLFGDEGQTDRQKLQNKPQTQKPHSTDGGNHCLCTLTSAMVFEMHLSTLSSFHKKSTSPYSPARKGSWRQDWDMGTWAGTHTWDHNKQARRRQVDMQSHCSLLMTMITNRFLLMNLIVTQFLTWHMFSSASYDVILAVQVCPCPSFISFSSVFSPKGDKGQQNYFESLSLLQWT